MTVNKKLNDSLMKKETEAITRLNKQSFSEKFSLKSNFLKW